LREGYGAVSEQGVWRMKSNQELRELYKTPLPVADIEQRILLCLGHENRMDQTMTKNVFKNKPEDSKIMRRSR
jgi:hypothetical protein